MAFLNLQKKRRWNVYAHVRVVPGPKARPDTIAFYSGVVITDGEIPKVKIPLSKTSDKEYRYFLLGENVPVYDKSYAWLAPVNNPDEVSAIWIDHFLFVDSSKSAMNNETFLEYFKEIPRENIHILSPGCYFENQKVFREFDNQLNRDILRLVTNCSDWAIQTKLDSAAKLGGKWDLYVSVKVVPGSQATAQSIAFNGGCVVASGKIHRRDVKLSETDSRKYNVIKLAENLELTESSTMFMAPKNNQQEITDILIDKVVLIRKD